jgi:hypothetical protein
MTRIKINGRNYTVTYTPDGIVAKIRVGRAELIAIADEDTTRREHLLKLLFRVKLKYPGAEFD